MKIQIIKDNDKVVEMKLVSIEPEDLEELKDGNKLEIPDGVTKIGAHACREIRAMKRLEIKMPDTVLKIEEEAFFDLNIEKITFSNHLEEIGQKAFAHTDFNSEIEFPETLSTLGDKAFESSRFATKLVLPDKIKTIPVACFQNGVFLNGIELPKYLGTIDTYAFYVAKVNEITIPNTVTHIGAAAFCWSSIGTITLSDNLASINRSTFYGTYNLEEIKIPDKVLSIDKEAFKNSSLKNIGFNQNLVMIDTEAFKATQLCGIDLPNSLEDIGSRAFSDCRKLEIVKLPKKLFHIRAGAFRNCKLKELKLPQNVITIEPYAFADNDLTSVTMAEEQFLKLSKHPNNAFVGNCPNMEINLYQPETKPVAKRKIRKIMKEKNLNT